MGTTTPLAASTRNGGWTTTATVAETDRVLGKYASEASRAEAVRMPNESKARLKGALRAAASDGDANSR